MPIDVTYSKKELKSLTDDELLSLLKKDWNILENEPIKLIGEYGKKNVTGLKILNKIVNIQNLLGKAVAYPVKDLKPKILEFMFKWDNSLKNSSKYISFTVELASLEERLETDNPLKLSILEDSAKLVERIPKTNTFNAISIGGDFFLETSTIEYIANKRKVTIEEGIANLELTEKEILIKQSRLEDTQKTLQTDLLELTRNHNKKIKQLSLEEEKKQDYLDQLETSKELVVIDIESKEKFILELGNKIDYLKNILIEEEDIMGKKLEKLRAYIKDKANLLLDLEFIDEEEYNNLLMINKDTEVNEKHIDFENELEGNKQKAISHIQAYLFAQDIVYPRYILEDFLALVQTNDLIILAGESGSGKTNLIKSFAKAVGGKSFIIPVKPNWTSSEDLLGYYNPLEKKYLTTPFLEALLEAKDNPEVPYFICLDEMNLARVEYYFADFLSLLEERGEVPEIKLYSEDESSHILSEIKNVIDTIDFTKEKYKKNNIINFMQLIQDEEINKELTRIFGFSDKDSLIKYHTDLRRMLSGILNTPSSITFPSNVRIIGAINIDETTHYLSPKILDRAHIMKFDSPLLQDWDLIASEIVEVENKDLKIKFKIENLGTRKAYPSFDRDDDFCKIITDMTRKYFSPLGIEVGLRTIRQGLNYQEIFIEQGSHEELVLNNFILHKILPKMTFDGSKSVKENVTKKNILLDFKVKLDVIINRENIESKGIYVIDEINKIVANAESNDEIVNYWA